MTGLRYSLMSSLKVSSLKLTYQLPSFGPMVKPPEIFLEKDASTFLPRVFVSSEATHGSN